VIYMHGREEANRAHLQKEIDRGREMEGERGRGGEGEVRVAYPKWNARE
jgi:hypothetical protein